MKRIIIFLLLFAAIKVAGQTTGYLRFDTVKIMKQNGTCELYVINKTKDSLGLLTNVGGGLTQFKRSRMLNDSTLIIGLDTLTVHGTGGGGAGSVTSISQGFGIIHTPNPIISTGTIKADTTKLATVTSLRDSLLAHPTLIVDTVVYVHTGPELDTLTFTELIGKDIISTQAHPFVLHEATTYPPAVEDVWINNVTGGVKFGTPLQSGQTVTFIYKYSVTTGTPIVQSVNRQTGTISTLTALTSDVVASGTGSVPATIANDAVTFAKMQNISTNKLLGRSTASTGDIEELTIGAGLTLSGGTLTNTGTPGSGATLSQVDSAKTYLTGKTKAVYFDCLLRPTWGGSSTTWDILGQADAHDTLATGGLTVSTVGGQLRVSYPSVDYIASFSTAWDDQLQKNVYSSGGSTGLTFMQITIWKNFHQKDVWLGSDLLDGSFSNASGSTYRVKCDTSTGLFTIEWNLNTSDTLYHTTIVAGNYNANFPQVRVVQMHRSSTTSCDFYLTDGLTGQPRKGLLTTNDNFFVEVSGRKAVNADTENFGTNAAIGVHIAARRL